MKQRKLVVGITAASSVILLEGQLAHFKALGYDTYLMAPEEERSRAFCEKEGCTLLPIRISREISIKSDISTLLQVYSILSKLKPDVVNFGTPKVSLIGLFVSKILGIKNRIYTCRGFRFEHESGFKRKLLIAMERITANSAHEVICISKSVRTFGVKERIFSNQKSQVIHFGSSNGVNLSRFNPEKVIENEIVKLKAELGLHEKFVFGFVGRIVDRKGVKELYQAFSEIHAENKNTALLIVGGIEWSQITDRPFFENLHNKDGVVMTGPQPNVPLYISAMDLFVLPAWWEGFGNVLIQAAAMNRAVISTHATGTQDAVSDGYNGILVEPKNVAALKSAMLELMNDEEKRNQLANNGATWAYNFNQSFIWEGMQKLYTKR